MYQNEIGANQVIRKERHICLLIDPSESLLLDISVTEIRLILS